MQDASSFDKTIGAVDSPWTLAALIVLCFTLLAWRFLGKILEDTKEIKTSIITNHGSKNLGDAIDRLTETVARIDQRQDSSDALLRTVARDQERHILECREYHQPGKFIEKDGLSNASGL